MPIFVDWFSGSHGELDSTATLLNAADPEREDHVAAMEALAASLSLTLDEGGDRLLYGLNALADAIWTPEEKADHPLFDQRVFRAVDDDWFSENCMWRFDAVLSPRQMHEIMRAGVVRLLRIRCDSGRSIESLVQCNHDRMKVAIHEDQSGKIARRWIYAPTNSGWIPGERDHAVEEEIVAELVAIANDYPPGEGRYGAGTTERAQLLSDIDSVVNEGSQNFLVYRDPRVPFNWGGGYESPAPAGGTATTTRFAYGAETGQRPEPEQHQVPADSDHPTGPLTNGYEIAWAEAEVPEPAPHRVETPTIFGKFPIRWDPSEELSEKLRQQLGRVQANVLRPHGENHLRQMPLKIDNADLAIRSLAELKISDAASDLDRARVRWAPGAGEEIVEASDGPVVMIYLSQRGIDRIAPGGLMAQISGGFPKAGFADGRPRDDWHPAYQEAKDVMISVAGPEASIDLFVEGLVGELDGGHSGLVVNRAHIEHGRREHAGDPRSEADRRLSTSRDAFGNVDGISNPRFFTSDVRQTRPVEGAQRWQEAASPKQVLCPDPLGGFGSYYVFQKLETNADAFAALVAERDGESKIVGRTADGTLDWHKDADPRPEWMRQFNDFDWRRGRQQPLMPDDFVPHIRAMNPRRPDGPVIARRGMPYGVREDDRGAAGMLFAAYTSDIETNFVAMENAGRIANDPFIPGDHTDVVTLRGGDFFYAPPPHFFVTLRAAAGA